MCYSNCPHENYYGECKGNQFFSKIDAHCNTSFICAYCGEESTEEMASKKYDAICFECEEAYAKENE